MFVVADLTEEEVGRYSGFKVVKTPLIEKINMRKQTNTMIPLIKWVPLIVTTKDLDLTDFISPPRKL